MLQVFCIGHLVSYFVAGQTEISRADAFWYAAGIVLCSCVWIATFHPFGMWTYVIATKCRVGCAGLIYRKSLRLPQQLISDGVSGHILNILANDLYRAENGIGALATICTGPLGVLLFGFVIYMETGFSGIVGILFMLVFVPIQSE